MQQPRRASRSFATPTVASLEDAAKFPSVRLDLVEALAEAFPRTLVDIVGTGLDGAVDCAIHAAEQRGREQVLSFLRGIATKQLQR